MNKKVKYSIIILTSIAYLVLSYFIELIKYDFLVNLITISGALVVYFYNDSITFYTWWNEILNKYKRKPQVTWRCNYAVSSTDEDCFEITKDELTRLLERNDNENSIKVLEDTDNTFRIQTEAPYLKQYSIDKLYLQEDIVELNISYKSTLSYTDSKSEFDNSITFFNEISKKFSICEEDIDILVNPPTYNVQISIENMNPFYGLITKKIEEESVGRVTLKFEYGTAKIETNNNNLSITSSDTNEIKRITKKYIALLNAI